MFAFASEWQARYVVMSVVCLVALFLLVRLIAVQYFRFRGTKLVRCPETKAFAAVKVAAGRCALKNVLGNSGLRLSTCSRWPERLGCDQECLRQVELAPAECLLRNILERWYDHRSCVYCGRKFDELHQSYNKPALLSPAGTTLEWETIAPELIPAALETHRPVCWNCHIAMTFRSEHPELVVDRPWPKNEFGEINTTRPGGITSRV